MPHERFVEELRRALPDALYEADGRAVLMPATRHDLVRAVRLADELGGALRPPGAEPRPEAVDVDLRRLDDVLAFDETSGLAHVQAGVLVAEIEAQLERRGMTLGLAGPAPEWSLGRWIAEGAPGARAHADDPVDQLLAGIELVLPDGHVVGVRPAPRRAVGPDLVGAVVGARGRLGVLTAAHLLIRHRAPMRALAFRFSAVDDARAALAWIRGRGVRPSGSSIGPDPRGADATAILTLQLAGPEARTAAAVRVVQRTVAERGGTETETPEPSPAGPAPARPPDPLVGALAAELDPRGVLGS